MSDVPCPAFKLVRLRKNGTLGPLFINRKQVIPIGVWLKAKRHPTKGYAVRRGWHVTRRPRAPHLSMKGRIWVAVEVKDFKEFPRPDAQGGKWLIAQWMRVLPPKVSRTFRTHKIDDGLYVASALCGELSYGPTRRSAVKILRHELHCQSPQKGKS